MKEQRLINIKSLPERNYILILLVTLGIFLRFFNLGVIPGPAFDEVYYPVFALDFLSGKDYFSVHPPVGVYLTSISIYLYSVLPWTDSLISTGFEIENLSSISYRWLPAVVGSSLTYIAYLVCLQIHSNKNFALLVAFYFCVDGSMLVDSRFGLINIYLVFFGFLGLLFFLRMIKATGNSWHLLLSSLCLGLAIAVKWNGLGFLAVAVCFMLFLSFTRLRGYKFTTEEVIGEYSQRKALIPLIALTTLVYFAAWGPYFSKVGEMDYLDKHSQLLSFHAENTDEKTHPYESRWFTWPLVVRPMGYYFKSAENSVIELDEKTVFTSVHLLPNPVLYWCSFVAVIILGGRLMLSTAKLIDSKLIDSNYLFMFFVTLGYLGNFLPWSLVSRSTFIYHYQPSSGFAFLALAFLMTELIEDKKQFGSQLYLLILIMICLSGFYWIPLQLGLSITSDYFYGLMWFKSWI